MAHDLLGRLEVIAGHRLLEVATGAGEFARVDVNDRHGLSAVNDEGAARRQPHLTTQGLLQLLIDAVGAEGILAIVVASVVAHNAVRQVVRHGVHVGADRVVGTLAVHNQGAEVLVEKVAHDLDEQVRLFVQGDRLGTLRCLLVRGAGANVLPQGVQAVDVGRDVLLRHVLRCGTNDGAAIPRDDALQNPLEALALRRRQLAGDSRAAPAGHIHQEAAGQRNLSGQARALVADRILGHLN